MITELIQIKHVAQGLTQICIAKSYLSLLSSLPHKIIVRN